MNVDLVFKFCVGLIVTFSSHILKTGLPDVVEILSSSAPVKSLMISFLLYPIAANCLFVFNLI